MAEKEATILQLVAIDETGDSYYRMRWPARQLAQQMPSWRILNLDARSAERFLWSEHADLLVVYQSHDLDLLPVLEKRRAAGKKTLVEYNDNFYAPPPSTPVASAWSSPVLWHSYERFMHESDGVIVTGPGLKRLFSKVTKLPIHILENHIPHDLPAFEELWEKPGSEIRIGIAGSLGHMSDYLAVLPTLREFFARHPKLMLHVMGNETIPELLGLPPERFRFTPWGTMQQYFEFWKPVHIGIAPLLDTAYNRCRSDVKALEMSACGVLPVLTKALPYEHFLEKTKAPAFGSFTELTSLLEKLMKDPAQIEKKTRQCFEYVKAERLGAHRRERLELYQEMLPSKRSSFAWSQPLGCHEMTGATQDQTREGIVLKEIQDLFAAKQLERALKLAQAELAQNRFLAGVALAELRLLAAMAAPAQDWDRRYEEHRKNFVDDVRFLLLRTRRAKSVDELSSHWKDVRAMLEKASPVYREFFAMMTAQTYNEQLQKVPELYEVAESLSRMFPAFCSLRFAAARALEREGKSKDAAEQLKAIIESRDVASVNQEFFKTVDLVYLKTWLEGLEGRVKLGGKK